MLLPEYESDLGDAGQGYMRDTHSAIGGPRLSGTFRWHELWERFCATIIARGTRQVWRHKKRGTIYNIVGIAELQVSARRRPAEGDRIVIYVGSDGKMWARSETEFLDGRFEHVVGLLDVAPRPMPTTLHG